MKNKNKIVFLILTISFVLFMMVFMRIESDYLWHFKAGEYMFLNHTILKHDIFSWSIPGAYWMSHEWGFEIIIYVMYLIFGKYNIFVYGLICLLVLFLILYYINQNKIEKNKLFGVIWLFSGIILGSIMMARPHLISSILLLLTCWFCLDLFDNKESKKIYFLPLIAIIWVNIHGGSSNLVYLIPIMFIIGGLFKFNLTKIESKRISLNQIIKYLSMSLISALCLLINPHGFKMITYPYENMLNATMLSSISEWQPSVISNRMHLIYFVFAFAIVLIFILSKKKIRLIDGILFLFCLYLGLSSIRFWEYTFIIMSLIVFDYIPSREDDPYTNIFILGLSALLVFIFGWSFNKNIMVNTTKKELSDEFINVIKKENPERLFNSYGLGGILIYNDIDVFIDGRADLYNKHNYVDNLRILHIQKDFRDVMNRYDFDYYLLTEQYAIFNYIQNNDSFKEVYTENGIWLFKKIKKEV